jgi:O-antigen ligase
MQKLLKTLDGLIKNKLKPLTVVLERMSIHKYAVGALLLAIPLYPKFPFISVPGTHVSIRLEDFLILIVTAISVVLSYSKLREYWKLKITKAFVVFWLVGLISVLSAVLVTKTAPAHIAFLHLIRRIEYMAMFFVGYIAIKDKLNLKFFVRCLMVVVFFAFLYGVGQKYFSLPIITTQNEEYAKGRALYYTVHGHLVSTFAGHYDLASYLILISPILVVILFSDEALTSLNLAKSKRLARLILAVVVLQAVWLLVFSASRISIVSYAGSVSLALLLAKKYKAIPIVIAVLFLFTLISGNLLARYMKIFDVVKEKISVTVENSIAVHASSGLVLAAEDTSTSIRINVEWPRALRAFTKNPLLGTGFSSITLATDNDYLRLMGEIGLLGFFSFLLLFVRVILDLVKRIPYPTKIDLESAFVVGITGAIPGILLNAVFIDIFEASKFAIMFWLLIGIGLGLLKEKTYE